MSTPCDAGNCNLVSAFRSCRMYFGVKLYFNTCETHRPVVKAARPGLGYKCHVSECDSEARHRQWQVVEGIRQRVCVCSQHFNLERAPREPSPENRTDFSVASDSEAFEGRLFGVRLTKTSLEAALDNPPRPPRPRLDSTMVMVEGPPPHYFLTKCRCHTCSVIYRHWSPQLSPLEALSQAGFKWIGHGYECPRCVKERRLTLEARMRNNKVRLDVSHVTTN